MSIDAITYAKTLDVDNPTSRLLLFIIAENTFNDCGKCKVGQSVLAYETRCTDKTIRTHLRKLEQANVVKIKPRPKKEGGRLPDEIELIGFLDWLAGARKKPEPVNSSGSAEPVNSSGSRTGKLTPSTGTRNGRQGSVSDKTPVLVSPVQDAHTPNAPLAAAVGDGSILSTDDGGNGMALVRGVVAKPGSPDRAALDAWACKDTRTRKLLPFSREAIGTVRMMGVDVQALVDRYYAKTSGEKIDRPSAYLIAMAKDEIAQRIGVSAETVAIMARSGKATKAQTAAAELAAMKSDGGGVKAGDALKAALSRLGANIGGTR